MLQRVLREDAWATPTLDATLSRAALTTSEAARATDIVLGVLRVLPRLERAIDAHRTRPEPLEPWVRAALLAASYELLHTPEKPWAIVDETVRIVRESRSEGLARFVNAVLRKLAAERPEHPERPRRIEVPDWLAERLRSDLGAVRARSFLDERPIPPPLTLRARTDRTALEAAIRHARPHAEVVPGALSPSALLVRSGGDPRKLPGHAEGAFTVMDEASQLVVRAVGARPGEHVVDACAGRGGKTLALLDAIEGRGRIVAVDDHPEKLARIDEERARLGLLEAPLERRAVDLTVGLGALPERSFDRVLVDAPCTGLGTVHRRPEILLRIAPDDPARLGALQLELATRAARLVRPGGLLVLAVCSPTRAEGSDVLVQLRARLSSAELVDHPVEGIACDDDGILRIGPWCDPFRACDAFQIVRLRLAAESRREFPPGR